MTGNCAMPKSQGAVALHELPPLLVFSCGQYLLLSAKADTVLTEQEDAGPATWSLRQLCVVGPKA